MVTLIYYFTGTGNSLVVARMLKNNIPDSELVPIAGLMLKEEKAVAPVNSNIGVVFPMYCGGFPNIVRRFLANSDFTKAKYVFTVNTQGGKSNGNPEKHIRSECLRAGHELDGSWWVQMPNNYIPMSDAIPRAEQERLTSEAATKVAAIAASVVKGEHVIEKEKFFGKTEWVLAGGWFMKKVPEFGMKYEVNDSCNGCMTCAKVCPVNNVAEGENGRPVWGHSCECCLACLQFCPKEAISCGKKTVKRKRYHHPDVNVQDMIGQKQ